MPTNSIETTDVTPQLYRFEGFLGACQNYEVKGVSSDEYDVRTISNPAKPCYKKISIVSSKEFSVTVTTKINVEGEHKEFSKESRALPVTI